MWPLRRPDRRSTANRVGERVARLPPVVVAAAFYALAVTVAFWPALADGRVLSASTDLYGWVPWAAHRPSGLSAYSNPLLSDHTRLFYPWLDWARQQLRAGNLPQWNPLTLSGTPTLANAEVQLFSPFSIPIWLLPFPFGFAPAAALKLWVGALGAYLFGRQLRLRFLPALTAGLIWGFAPYLVVWLSHSVDPTEVMLPWVLLFCERLVARGRWPDALGLSLAMAVAFTGGYPEGQAHMALAAVVYSAVRAATTPDLGLAGASRRLALVAAGLLLAGLMAAVALLPFLLSLSGTAGIASRAGGGTAEGLSGLRTILFPDWWGRPSGLSVPGPDNYNMRDFYAGAIALMLAAVALVSRGGWNRKLPLAVLLAIGMVVPVGLEPARWLFAHTPPFDHARNQLLVVLLDLAVAILAGFGLQELMSPGARLRRALGVGLAAIAAGVAGIAASGAGSAQLEAAAHHFASGQPVRQVDELAVVSSGWWLLLAIAFVAVVGARRLLPAAWVAVALVALVGIDAAHFFDGQQPMPPADRVFQSTPAIRFLQRHQGGWRVTAVAPAMPADTNVVYGLRDIRGSDPPQPALAYARLIRLGAPGVRITSRTAVEHLDPVRTRVLDLLSVRYVMAGPAARLSSLPGFRLVYAGADARIYENGNAVTPAFVPASVAVEPADAAALRTIAGPGFRPGGEVVTATPAPAGLGTARVIGDGNGGAVIVADMARPGLVVLSDAWAAGWTVTVDGRPATAVRVDTAIRGVVVPAGRHRIVWSYTTPGLSSGAALSALGWVGWLGGAVAWVIRRRRPAPAEAAPSSMP